MKAQYLFTLAVLGALSAQAQTAPPRADTLRLREVIAAPASARAQPGPLVQRTVAGKRLQLLVPTDFRPLDREAIAAKYPAQYPPQEVYSDTHMSVNLTFQLEDKPLDQSLVSQYLVDHLVAMTKRGRAQVQVRAQGVKTINGRKVAYLELLAPAIDTQVYTLLFVTDVAKRQLVCTFNCTEAQLEQWQPTAQRIMNSLRVL